MMHLDQDPRTTHCLFVASETYQRRFTRIALILAASALIAAVPAIIGFGSTSVSIPLGIALMATMWRQVSTHYQVALRPNDIFTTLGEAATPIKWRSIETIACDAEKMILHQKDGRKISIKLKPLPLQQRSQLVEFSESILEIYRHNGPLRIPLVTGIDIDSGRLRIRPINRGNEEDYIKLRLEPSETVNQLFSPPPPEMMPGLFTQELTLQNTHPLYWRLGICLKDNGWLIGYLTVSMNETLIQRNAQIGISISREYRSLGYGSEAIAAVLDFLEKESNVIKVTAGCFGNNPASARALEKGGFRKVGTFEKFWFRDDTWLDSIEFERIFQGNYREKEN